jgi:translation initiation factor IF-2
MGDVEIIGLKRGPQEAKEILEGEMCGVSFKTDHKIVLEEGDRLVFFSRETKIRTL